jgi:hypothetical protein
MRISYVVSMAVIGCLVSLACAGQGFAHSSPKPAAVHAPVPPSSLVQPSLDNLQRTLFALRLEKWKRGTVRDEASANVDAILRDMQQTLPSLLRDADAAPGALSKALPASRNLDALYDTFLRVEEASRIAAPSDQVTQLQQALYQLESARRALDASLQQTALEQETQISALKMAVKTEATLQCPVTPPPVAPVCVAPFVHHRTRRRHTVPARKPQTNAASASKSSNQKTAK